MTQKQTNAFIFLENALKKLKEPRRYYRDWVLQAVEHNIDGLKIVSNRFVFNKTFYVALLEYIKVNHKYIFERKEEVKLDNAYYKFFNTLKRLDYIHKNSTYFPKSLTLFSINPNPFSLLNVNFRDLDAYSNRLEEMQVVLEKQPSLEQLYIYLRMFHRRLFTRQMLETLVLDDVLLISSTKCVLVLYYKLFMKTSRNNKFYKTVVLDQISSQAFYSLRKILRSADDKRVFSDLGYYEEQLKKYKSEHLSHISMNLLTMINRSYYSFQENTVRNTLVSRVIQTVPLALSEIETLFPGRVSNFQLEKEHEYIDSALKRFEEIGTDKPDVNIDRFDLFNLLSLEVIIRTKDSSVAFYKITKAIEDINNRLEYTRDKSHEAIYLYIRGQLTKLLLSKIKIKTFQNYMYTLNKHIFNMINDLHHIQDYEIQGIIQRFENNVYTKNTVDTINTVMKSFFAFINVKGFVIDIPALLYPKSLVFKHELTEILVEIERRHTDFDSVRIGKRKKFILLQKKAMVIIAFYSGLRKSEVRSRLLRDVYMEGSALYIDVNPDGMKKLGLSLKTSSALRRVEAIIDDIEHLEIIQEWLQLRKIVKPKARYLFLQNDGLKISSKVIDETIFDEFNKVIKSVTSRYTTFHSLRHSYATYTMKKILDKNDLVNVYEVLELSIQMGHQTPDVTMNKYIHFDLINLGVL